MNGRARAVVLIAVATGIAAFLRRPVKRPRAAGTWEPVERQTTPR
ncbi:MAG: hypothetical protein ACE5GC_08290 [Acidimicrobiia bacterium]